MVASKRTAMVNYQIQICVPAGVNAYVWQKKTEILDEFGQYQFYASHPRLVAFHFCANICDELHIRQALKEAGDFFDPMDVALKGFSYISQSKTVQMNVSNARQLAAQFRLFYQKFFESASRLGVGIHWPVVNDVPHLTIGSGFEQRAFLKVFQAFIEDEYTTDFPASDAQLLRDIGNGKNDVVETFTFGKKSAVGLRWPEEKVWVLGEGPMLLFSDVA